MRRPASYATRHGDAVLAYLAAQKDAFVTAGQIAEELQKEKPPISRPTVYRQLEKLVSAGKARKYLFGGGAVSSYRYIDPANGAPKGCRLRCEVCDGIFSINCGEAGEVSRHIFEAHEFWVDDAVFYGKCKACLQKQSEAPV